MYDQLELIGEVQKASTHRPWLIKPPKLRRFIVVTLSLTALCLLAPAFLLTWPSQPTSRVVEEFKVTSKVLNKTAVVPNSPEPLDPFDAVRYLNGPATFSLYDNLRHDTKYITSWLAAGWTNDVMTYANLIYLGLITNRVPILGCFVPDRAYILTGTPILFSEVFDLPRLRKILQLPIIEWEDVKRYDSDVSDVIGCWSIWETVFPGDGPRGSMSPDLIGLDISYTPVPRWAKLLPTNEGDLHTSFWSLAELAFPEARNANLGNSTPSPRHHVTLHPNEHLVCYDYLYYVGASRPWEYEADYSPSFRFVLQHMHWTENLERIGDQYIRITIGVPEHLPTPHYISIHVRHHNFANMCGETPLAECFAPISAYARRVEEVKQELVQRKGLHVNHVIVTSDETDPAWWEEVKKRGWLRVDHSSTTLEDNGSWYPTLIDAVIQSHSTGFIGTAGSTYSLIGRRRCEAWHDCVFRTVKWGRLGADDP